MQTQKKGLAVPPPNRSARSELPKRLGPLMRLAVSQVCNGWFLYRTRQRGYPSVLLPGEM